MEDNISLQLERNISEYCQICDVLEMKTEMKRPKGGPC